MQVISFQSVTSVLRTTWYSTRSINYLDPASLLACLDRGFRVSISNLLSLTVYSPPRLWNPGHTPRITCSGRSPNTTNPPIKRTYVPKSPTTDHTPHARLHLTHSASVGLHASLPPSFPPSLSTYRPHRQPVTYVHAYLQPLHSSRLTVLKSIPIHPSYQSLSNLPCVSSNGAGAMMSPSVRVYVRTLVRRGCGVEERAVAGW